MIDISIEAAGRWERQPCVFGEYGIILFWSKNYEAKEISQQLEAILLGYV